MPNRPNVVVTLDGTDTQYLIRSMDDVRYVNETNGYHFFDRDSLRFFSGRVHETLYAGRYFVTGERRGFDDYRRAYTVREVKPNGSIETVGTFGQYLSRSGAHAAAQRLADRAHSMARHLATANAKLIHG